MCPAPKGSAPGGDTSDAGKIRRQLQLDVAEYTKRVSAFALKEDRPELVELCALVSDQ